MVELDDAVDRGLEHGPQSFLRLAERLVGPPETTQRLVGVRECGLLLLERFLDGALRVRAADLVHEDPQGDGRREHPDQHRGAQRIDPVVDLLHRYEREGTARRRDRQAREDRASVPRGLHPWLG